MKIFYIWVFFAILTIIRAELFNVDEIKQYIDESDTSLRFLGENQKNHMALLEQVMKKIFSLWDLLMNLFGNSRSKLIKGQLKGKGFDYFDSATQIQILAGVKEEGFDKMQKQITARLGVNEEKRNQVNNILEEIKFMESNTWTGFNFLFNIGKSGEVRYSALIANNQQDGKYNFIIIESEASLKLSPDLLVITKKVSFMGEMFSSEVELVSNIPRKINEDDISTAFYFFNLVAYKHVANFFNISLKLPAKIV